MTDPISAALHAAQERCNDTGLGVAVRQGRFRLVRYTPPRTTVPLTGWMDGPALLRTLATLSPEEIEASLMARASLAELRGWAS